MASSTPLLGLLLAVATWGVSFSVPIAGIDPSWISAVYMAAHRGLDFGTQIVFTWGPLSFLRLPDLYYNGLAVLGFVYSSILYCVFCVSLVWAARRVVSVWIALPLVFVVLAGLPVINGVIVLAAVWCLALLAPKPPPYVRWIVVFGIAAFGATECLVRLSPGPVVLIMGALTLLALETRWRDLAAYAATALGTFLALWLVTGQPLANIPDFVHASVEIVSGYGQAMALEQAHRMLIPTAVVIGVALAASAAYSGADRRRRILAGAVMALAAFTVFKEGVVRFEPGHAQGLFASLAALTFAVPWRRSLLPLAAALLVASAGIGLTTTPAEFHRSFNPGDHLDTFTAEVELLFDPGRRNAIIEGGREGMIASYDLDPATLRLLGDEPMEVEPWSAALAWAYRLRWSPLPVFQNYSAYTPYLDAKNAEALLAPDGPTRVLRENTGQLEAEIAPPTIDGRFEAWDPPQQQVALLCNFLPLRTTDRWQVLARSGDRCGTPRPLGSVETEYGQTIDVPQPKGDVVVLAKIHGAGVSGLERITAAFVRAQLRFITVNGIHPYRLVPGTTADGPGLIMRVPRAADFPGTAFRMSPDAETLSLSGVSGNLTVDFYAMPIRPRP